MNHANIRPDRKVRIGRIFSANGYYIWVPFLRQINTPLNTEEKSALWSAIYWCTNMNAKQGASNA